MGDYWTIAQDDLQEALFNMGHEHYRSAVYYFQQFAEKGAKALLEKKDPNHIQMRSHNVENILAAYDTIHKVSDLSDKARYITGFYFNTRYPGDNYTDINKAQAEKAYSFVIILNDYFKSELKMLNTSVASEKPNLHKCKPL
jgi:HEPN domain-containing protein